VAGGDLFAATVAGATYSWTGPSGFSSSEQNPAVAGVVAASAGTYNLTVTVGGCTSAAGTTSFTVLANKTACNDGDLCTFNDACDTGTCTGTSVVCTSDACATRACNGTSTCTVTPASDGTLCSDADACTTGDSAAPVCARVVHRSFAATTIAAPTTRACPRRVASSQRLSLLEELDAREWTPEQNPVDRLWNSSYSIMTNS
jgi:hypothetical protein